jgi:hypothetical protein
VVEVLNGGVELAVANIGSAPVAESLVVIWVAPDDLVEVLNGAVVLALEKVGAAAVVEGTGLDFAASRAPTGSSPCRR